MRFIVSLVLSTVLGVCSVSAQTETVTVTGTLNGGTVNVPGGGSTITIPSETSFTYTLQFNLANAVPTTGNDSGSPGVQYYLATGGTATISFDGETYTAAAPTLELFSNYFGLYGYEFSGLTSDNDGFAAKLWSADAGVTPDTSLNSIQTSPITDFGPPGEEQNTHVFVLDTAGGDIGGVVEGFSLTSAPEPSAFSLLIAGVVAFGIARTKFWRRYSARQGPQADPLS